MTEKEKAQAGLLYKSTEEELKSMYLSVLTGLTVSNVLQKDTMCLRRRLSTALNEWIENGNTITKPIRGRNGEASVLMRYC